MALGGSSSSPGVTDPFASSSAIVASASGWFAPAAEVGPAILRQPLLGDPRVFEEQHVPRLLVLLVAAGA